MKHSKWSKGQMGTGWFFRDYYNSKGLPVIRVEIWHFKNHTPKITIYKLSQNPIQDTVLYSNYISGVDVVKPGDSVLKCKLFATKQAKYYISKMEEK